MKERCSSAVSISDDGIASTVASRTPKMTIALSSSSPVIIIRMHPPIRRGPADVRQLDHVNRRRWVSPVSIVAVAAPQQNVCSCSGTAHSDLRQARRVLSSGHRGRGHFHNTQFFEPGSRSAPMRAAFLMPDYRMTLPLNCRNVSAVYAQKENGLSAGSNRGRPPWGYAGRRPGRIH
jgi:hypothetical protein